MIEATVPIAKPSKRAKTYWNEEYTRVTAKAKSLVKQATKCRNQDTVNQLKAAQEEKEATLKKAKRMYFRLSIYDSVVSL